MVSYCLSSSDQKRLLYYTTMDESLRKEFNWLFSKEGEQLVSQVENDFRNRVNALTVNKSLRKRTTPVRAAIVIEQAQLRIRAEKKFACADQMFFTRRGLEQSTSLQIARYKATRFAELKDVADICCGIGGDLIALAARAVSGVHTVGIDADELTAAIAGHNLAGVGIFNAELRHQSFEDADLSKFDGLHIDPDRRTKSRTVRGDFFQPSLPDIYAALSPKHTVAIKVAPATPFHEAMPNDMQREWIGDSRECKQQVLWSGPKTLKPKFTTATLVNNYGQVFTYSAKSKRVASGRLGSAPAIGNCIYEPHATVLASGLMSAFAEDVGLMPVSEHADYLTGSLIQKTPLLSEYKIVETLKLDLRKISATLRKLKIGEVIVKKTWRRTRNLQSAQPSQIGRGKSSNGHRDSSSTPPRRFHHKCRAEKLVTTIIVREA